MKKILLLLSLFFSPLFFAEDGPFTVFYGFQTENPLDIVAATDQLWEDCDKGDVVVSLNADAINGESTNTHTYVVNFPNNAAFVKWNNLFATCPGVQKYFETVNPIIEFTQEIMGLPLRGSSGGAAQSEYFQVFSVTVQNPMKFVKAYDELMESNTECDSWGLLAFGAGYTRQSGTHLAYCGFNDLTSYLEQAQVREPTEEFQKFIRKTFKISQLNAVSMVEVVKRY